MSSVAKAAVRISFSGRSSERAIGLDAVNAALRWAGCSLAELPAVPAVQQLLCKAASGQALCPDFEAPVLLHHYALNRADVLAAAAFSAREPAMQNGGAMATEEEGVPQYPKLYDMSVMGPLETRGEVYRKFGRLHVNSSLDGIGVDEVMQIPVGGPFVWFFRHPEPELGVMKLEMPAVAPGEPGWRLCYPGLTPHGAFMNPATGLVVAYITGPPVWHMQYAASGQDSNQWVDAAPEVPLLLDTPAESVHSR